MPPKKKAKTVKKPYPAYLAKLEKLKRRKRKYEPTEFTMYEQWCIFVKKSHEEIDMRKFEEEEEYFNNISKVKQELRDHPTRYRRDIVWVCSATPWEGNPTPLYNFNFVYHRDHDGDVEIEGDLPDELGVERLQDFLCEKFQIGEESISGGESGSEEEEEVEEEEKEEGDTNAWIILFKNRDKALKEKEKVAKEFFHTAVNGRELEINDFSHDVKDIKESLASLPENTEIGLAEDGTLYVNGCRRENFHAKGCPFKTEVDGVKYIVDGTGDYDGFSDACAGLEFSGTLTNVENKKVFNFSFSYKHNGGNGAEEYEELEWEGLHFEEENIEEIAMEVVSNYEFVFCE